MKYDRIGSNADDFILLTALENYIPNQSNKPEKNE